MHVLAIANMSFHCAKKNPLSAYLVLTGCHIFSSSIVIESACCSYRLSPRASVAWNKVSAFAFTYSTYWTVWFMAILVFCYTTVFRT